MNFGTGNTLKSLQYELFRANQTYQLSYHLLKLKNSRKENNGNQYRTVKKIWKWGLIITQFGDVLLGISPGIVNGLKSYIKHSKEIFIPISCASRLFKKTWLHLVF